VLYTIVIHPIEPTYRKRICEDSLIHGTQETGKKNWLKNFTETYGKKYLKDKEIQIRVGFRLATTPRRRM
jgi:hypothetical protein